MPILVVSEKPSAAMSVTAVLGAKSRKHGYMEGNGWLVSWCVGHLAGLPDAQMYDPKYEKWRREDLPILPESWKFIIGKGKQEQFDVLCTLLRREDVTEPKKFKLYKNTEKTSIKGTDRIKSLS